MSLENIIKGGVKSSVDTVKNTVKKIPKRVYNPTLWFEAEKLEDKSKNLKEEAKKIIKEYREECFDLMYKEYGWPKYISRSVANLVRPARDNVTFNDYFVGWLGGGLPQRYVEAFAKLRNVDRKVYTRTSIYTDGLSVAISSLVLMILKDAEIPKMIAPIYDIIGRNMYEPLLYTATAIRTAQIPYRTYHYRNGKHKPSYAALVSTIIVPSLIFARFLFHDIVQSYKERKQSKTVPIINNNITPS